MWPFKSSPLLEPETAAWHKENFRWLVETFGAETGFQQRELVLPTSQSFTTAGKKGHDLAIHILEQVKAKAGLDRWPVELAPHDVTHKGDYVGTNLIRPEIQSGAAGTFSVDPDSGVVITYSVALLSDPHGMVATFAHELSHYLLATHHNQLPVPREEEEFLTDLTAAFLGFGVFLTNTRFRYEQFSDGATSGWGWKRQGYLPESDLLFATALFMRARGLPLECAHNYIKPYLQKNFARAYLEARDFQITAPA